MKNRERISALRSRMHDLKVKIESLDYVDNKIIDARYLHGEAAAKKVADEYRERLLEREAWRQEWNEIEAELVALEAEPEEEPEIHHGDE